MRSILLAFFFGPLCNPIFAQTLPSYFKADFLNSNTVLVHIGEKLGSKLTFTASGSGGAYCCDNFFTGESMMNYDFTITVENETASSIYFVRMPQNGIVLAKGTTNRSECSFTFQTYIGIGTEGKTFRLDPGQKKEFQAKTKMDYQNYYPVTRMAHDDLMNKDPNALDPNCMSFMIYSKEYNQSQIKSVLTSIQNSKGSQSSINGIVVQTEEGEFTDFIDGLEEEFEYENQMDANEAKEEVVINKEASVLVLKPDEPVSDVAEIVNYDLGLCNELKQEVNELISLYDNEDAIVWTDKFAVHIEKRRAELENQRLDPICNEQISEMLVTFFTNRSEEYVAEYDELYSKYGHYLNDIPGNNSSNTSNSSGFHVIPSTMTPDYLSPIPGAIPNDNFETGDIAPTPKKVNY